MRILQEESIGLIIDIQERLFPHIHKYNQLAINTSILINGLKALQLPIMVTEQYTKGLGPTITPINAALGEFKVYEKMSFSCLDDAPISEQIALKGKHKIIIVGIEAHVCVLQTVIDLINNGYQAIVVEDCIASRKENDKQIAIERMRKEGAFITSYESVLFELCRFAGNDTFKAISKLVK